MKKTLLFSIAILAVIGFLIWKLLLLPVDLKTKPVILGHGGMGISSVHPLNSVSSITEALSYPIHGTELDVRMTKDEVLVAFHDGDLSKATNCTGLISETELINLKDCKNATWKNAEPIAQLDKILSLYWPAKTVFSLDLKFDSDIKSSRGEVYQTAIAEVISDYPEFRFLIESQNIEILRKVKTLEPKAEVFYYAHNGESDVKKAVENDLDGISINRELISEEEIKLAQNAGLQVMLWGTGSVFSNRETLEMGSDIIQTDDIGTMVKLLDN